MAETRFTPLEDRMAAMRLLFSSLVAHLEDNGLIDRDLLERDLWMTARVGHLHESAEGDLRHVFAGADALLDEWQRQRDEGPDEG